MQNNHYLQTKSGYRLFSLLFAVFLVMAILPARSSGRDPLDPEKLAQAHALLQGYLANYEGFQYYSVVYTIRSGRAANIEEALKKGPTQKVIQGKLTVLLDDDNRLSRQVEVDMKNAPPPVSFKGSNGTTAFSGVSFSQASISNGKFSLSNLSGGTITRGYDPASGVFVITNTPWNHNGIAVGGDTGTLGSQLQVALDHKDNMASIDVEPSSEIVGHPTTKLSFSWPAKDKDGAVSGSSSFVYYVDEQCGFLARRFETISNFKPVSTAYTTDIRRCSNGRWFPTRCVSFSHSGPPGSNDIGTCEIVATNLEVNKRPRKDDFTLTLEAGRQVNDGVTPGSAFTLNKAQAVTLDNLETLYERTQSAASQREVSEPAPAPAQWQTWLAFSVGTLVILGAVVAFLRYRSRS